MRESKVTTFFWQLLDSLPLLAPAVLAVFSSVVIFSLLTFGLKSVVVWPVGLLLSVLPLLIIWKHNKEKLSKPELKQRRWFNLIVLIGVTVWVVFNLFFVAHDVFITRDPGIYTVTGQWLTNHEKTNIQTPPIEEGENGLSNYSSGIWLTMTSDKTILQPQGMHLLPALLGLAGRLFGPNGVFKANIFFGGLALLSLYGFARMIMKPGWATLSTLVVAVSLPLIYFSRHTYTEIIALALTFGALSSLWLAQTAAKTDKKLWLWLLAGFIVGAGTMVRPDAYLSVAAVAVYLVVVTALSAKNERLLWVKRSAAYLLAAAVPMTLALLDLQKLTHSYYINTGRGIKMQLALLVAIITFGAILIALSWRTKILKFLDSKTKNWRALTAACLVITGFFMLMLRPALFYFLHHGANNTGQLYGYSVRGQTNINTSPKLVTDHTMDWISWYIGLPLLWAGFIGMAITASRVMKDRFVKMLPFLMVVGLTILMYGTLPRISLDQIWAIRRFLPVILPGLVVFGVYAFQYVLSRLNIEARLKQVILFFGAAFIVLTPLTITRPFLFVKEGRNNYENLKTLCRVIPDNAQVIWLGTVLERDAVHTTRTYCGNYSLGYSYTGRPGFKADGRLDARDLKSIAAINRAANRPTILVVRSNRAVKMAPQDRQQFTKIIDYTSTQPETSYYNAPRQNIDVTDGFEIARLDEKGNLVKFPQTVQN